MPVLVMASDSFGQHQTAGLIVYRPSTEPPPPPHESSPPTVTAALAHDTAPGGQTNTDGVTYDPTIAGMVDSTGPVQLRAWFDGTPATQATDITATLGSDDHFTLDRVRLASLHGGALPDGSYRLHLQAVGPSGRAASPVEDVTFALDTMSPTVSISIPPPDLVTNTNVTAEGQVSDNLAGVKQPGSPARQGSYVPIPFDPETGNFTYTTNLVLDGTTDGAHTLAFRAVDRAGNFQVPPRGSSRSTQRLPAFRSPFRLRRHRPTPTRRSRAS